MRKLKKIFSLVLAVVMTAGLMPLMGVPETEAIPTGAMGYGSNGRFLAPIEPITDFTDWTAISDRAGLEAIASNLSGKYYLTGNIDLSGGDWVPLGGFTGTFTGIFDGQGHIIDGLYILATPLKSQDVGLFARTDGAVIRNVGINIGSQGVNFEAFPAAGSYICVGGLIGRSSDSTIVNCFVDGSVVYSSWSDGFVGGLIGEIGGTESSNISYSYAKGSVTARMRQTQNRCFAGGLVGNLRFWGVEESVSISSCYAEVDVYVYDDFSWPEFPRGARIHAGGLIGNLGTGLSVKDSYATGNVTAHRDNEEGGHVNIGGLFGNTFSGIVENSYAIGDVRASSVSSSEINVGGFAGRVSGTPQIINSYRLDTQIVSGGTIDTSGIPKTSGQLQTEQLTDLFGANSENVWSRQAGVNNSYPFLNPRSNVNMCSSCQQTVCTCPDEPDPTPTPDPNGLFSGIDYDTVTANEPDTALTAITFSFKSGTKPTNPADFSVLSTASINLTREAIIVPGGYNVEAFSVDGGKTWKAGDLPEKGFKRLLNKGGELWLCYKDYNPNAKKPQGSGNEHNIIAFPKINQRPKAPRMAVNYLLNADPTGNTAGYWLLVNRADAKNPNPQAQRGADIQIGAASGRTVDEKHFGQFYAAPNHGIPVLKLEGTKPAKTTYFVRLAPKQEGAAFTPASRAARVKVTSELKETKYKIRTKDAKGDKPATAIIKLKANTYTIINGTTKYHKDKETVDVLSVTGDIVIWNGATAKKPSSKKQTLGR
jgi:hypothetical protein